MEADTRPVTTPVAKRPKSEELQLPAGANPLNVEDSTFYMAVTMRVNFLSVDRADFLVIRRRFSGTRDEEESHDEGLRGAQTCWGDTREADPLKRSFFERQAFPGVLQVFCDADHAGDLESRKSRSGMAVVWWVTLDQAWDRGAGRLRKHIFSWICPRAVKWGLSLTRGLLLVSSA